MVSWLGALRRTGRLATAVGWAWLMLAGPVRADPLQVRVIPGGALLEDMDVQPSQVLASATEGSSGTLQWNADRLARHHYRIRRPHFETLDLQVWSTAAGQWRYATTQREGLLDTGIVLSLGRVFRLNVRPEDARVFLEAEAGNGNGASPSDQVLDIAGARRRIVPVPQQGPVVTLAAGYKPPVLYLVHPRFAPQILQIPEGALDSDAMEYPAETIELRPLYGPFSYPAFDIIASLILVSGALGWWWLLRPRLLAARQMQQHEHELLEAIISRRPKAEPLEVASRGAGSQGPLSERTIVTETGQQYLLLTVLGEGGMGSVYEAMSTAPGVKERVAVKVLSTIQWQDAEVRTRFLREITICMTMQHPSIVKVLDWGTLDDTATAFMVMEKVSGRTFRHIISQQGTVAPEQVMAWLLEILAGLAVAHQAGIVHRDLKPANLMLTDRGHVKIIDFGLAHQADADLTPSNAFMGTPFYMSPEHFRASHVTPASDIYSLGMVAFELLTGQVPFDKTGTPMNVMARILIGDMPDILTYNPTLPPELAAVVRRMLARELDERFSDAVSVKGEIEALARGNKTTRHGTRDSSP